MKKFILINLSLLFICEASAVDASAQRIQRQILGLHLNVTMEATHKRLQEIGTVVRHEENRQEVWQIRHESFSHLLIGFDKADRLRYVTAVAREDKGAKRVAYNDIGDVKKARQAGDPKINNFNYQWELPAADGNPHMLVIVAGRTPKLVTTYTLKSLESTVPLEKD
jgi:hypothetical protein